MLHISVVFKLKWTLMPVKSVHTAINLICNANTVVAKVIRVGIFKRLRKLRSAVQSKESL